LDFPAKVVTAAVAGSVPIASHSIGQVQSVNHDLSVALQAKAKSSVGAFVPKHTVKRITASLSEWESFKLFLPSAINRLFFTPARSEIDALQTVQKMLLDALRDAPGTKRDAPNSAARPN
jgi:hypothetical protein